MKKALPKINIFPTDTNNKHDKKLAKQLEKLVNYQAEGFAGVLEAIAVARTFVDKGYGVKTPDSIWNRIAEETVRLFISQKAEK